MTSPPSTEKVRPPHQPSSVRFTKAAGPEGIEPPLVALETTALPLSYRPERRSGHRTPPVTALASPPLAWDLPAYRPLRPNAGRERGGIRTHTVRYLKAGPLPLGYASFLHRALLAIGAIRAGTRETRMGWFPWCCRTAHRFAQQQYSEAESNCHLTMRVEPPYAGPCPACEARATNKRFEAIAPSPLRTGSC